MAYINEFFESKSATTSRPHTPPARAAGRLPSAMGPRFCNWTPTVRTARKDQGTVSQSIQSRPRAQAQELLSIIRKTFPGL